jgi:hypothetical protein
LLGEKPTHRDCAVSGCFTRAQGTARPKKCVTPFLVTERWGYAPVGPHGQPQLFDLSTDPLAERNIIADHASVARDLHALLMDHLEKNGAPDTCATLWRDIDAASVDGGAWAVDYPDE